MLPLRLLGYTREMVREAGLEPAESPRSERGAFANLTTPATTGAHGGSRTHKQQALDLPDIPVLLRAHGPSGRIRTDKPRGLSSRGRPVPFTPGD